MATETLMTGEFIDLQQASDRIMQQAYRIQELMEHNTKLEERARKAERERDSLREALLAAAKMGGKIARELQREIEIHTQSV